MLTENKRKIKMFQNDYDVNDFNYDFNACLRFNFSLRYESHISTRERRKRKPKNIMSLPKHIVGDRTN